MMETMVIQGNPRTLVYVFCPWSHDMNRCVNAVSWSSDGGTLISSGDDLRYVLFFAGINPG
jgi:hypothetical protein